MLSPQALFALTYVSAVPLIAFSIVAGMNNKPRAKKWYGVFGVIFLLSLLLPIFFFLLNYYRIK